ncbi:flagellar hook-basal body complex protein FliE [Jannaschia faecimaris]|uniref:Flagellar hook-basal body complex protein FliE n=1 Tax=Jannaschia faecimaris TaxID=1244108 RepID=A0A1H3JWF1_9RHOB|nr:flagellar hook-basal body complex protein FliE [Jannaschia faecimaris]SDY44201.1 flagellar hook-basal body complex protein FliE [Jannaschia faecimaris]
MDLNPILVGLGRTPVQKPNAAREAIAGFTDLLEQGEMQSTAAVTTGTDPHSLVTALAESKLAVDAIVTVRDRVVEAYQEILRMPV